MKATTLLLFTFVPLLSYGGTIVSQTGTFSSGFTDDASNQNLAVGWTQTQGFANVSISAALSGSATQTSVSVQLTDRIGPGTTNADVLYSTVVSLPNGNQTYLPVFSGLTLGPGTYYLVTSKGSVWWGNNTGSSVAGPGVSNIQNLYTPYLQTQTFAPSGSFTVDTSSLYFVTITGDVASSSTPEPEPLFMIGLPVTALFARRLKTKANSLPPTRAAAHSGVEA